MSGAEVACPFRLWVSIILDTAALTWLSVPHGQLPCLASRNAWGAPVVPRKGPGHRGPRMLTQVLCPLRVVLCALSGFMECPGCTRGLGGVGGGTGPLLLTWLFVPWCSFSKPCSVSFECPEKTGSPGRVGGPRLAVCPKYARGPGNAKRGTPVLPG